MNHENAIVILLVGEKGLGKTTFINFLSHQSKHQSATSSFIVGETNRSETREITTYKINLEGLSYHIIDTPGFARDQFQSDPISCLNPILEVLKCYTTLHAILWFLYPNPRATSNVLTFKTPLVALCGGDQSLLSFVITRASTVESDMQNLIQNVCQLSKSNIYAFNFEFIYGFLEKWRALAEERWTDNVQELFSLLGNARNGSSLSTSVLTCEHMRQELCQTTDSQPLLEDHVSVGGF
eukprot:TRINITY_DN3665_c0_g1_i6.p1 TRINITY_DN3665_c0_g1~~TRINITY_DN3665_c0_g1_i6.p1  ORF type:complete len:239 (+),score=-1.07 TRINITY_DN3665_c0_g1_i6:88-804(+)